MERTLPLRSSRCSRKGWLRSSSFHRQRRRLRIEGSSRMRVRRRHVASVEGMKQPMTARPSQQRERLPGTTASARLMKIARLALVSAVTGQLVARPASHAMIRQPPAFREAKTVYILYHLGRLDGRGPPYIGGRTPRRAASGLPPPPSSFRLPSSVFRHHAAPAILPLGI